MDRLTSNQVKSQVVDHLGLVAATISKLGLVEKTDALLPVSKEKGAKISMGQRLAAMVLNGLGFMDDRLYMFPDFLANKPVERLLGENLKAAYFNDDALGRFLDEVYDYGVNKFFIELAFDVGVEQKLLGKSAHFDTSTLSVYGDYAEVPSAMGKEKDPFHITYGYSKAHRPDLKQRVINLATTGASGFPIWMEAHSGHASDKRIMQSAAKRMRTFSKTLKKAPDFLYVGDSAFYENSVKHGGDMKGLSRVPERLREAKALLYRPDERFTWKTHSEGYRIAAVSST